MISTFARMASHIVFSGVRAAVPQNCRLSTSRFVSLRILRNETDSPRHPLIRQFLLALFILATGVPAVMAQDVIINEFMSSNDGYLLDEDGDASDWIELYNRGDVCVTLSGYALSDNAAMPEKWSLPDTLLPAHGFMLVFASGKDRGRTGAELHSNFKISASGEELLLSYRGLVVQHLPPVISTTNSSHGLMPDGVGNLVKFPTPTPGAPNHDDHLHDVVVFSHPSGMYPARFDLELYCTDINCAVYYTLDGEEPSAGSIPYTGRIQVSDSLCGPLRLATMLLAPPDLHVLPELPVPRCVMLRAAAFDAEGRRRSDVVTRSYFVGEAARLHGSLPVLSLAVAPDDLLDDSTGIMVPGVHWSSDDPHWTGNYFQRGEEWERAGTVEYFSPEGSGFSHAVGVRIHGQFSRRRPQKGFTLYARNEYGGNAIHYPLFPEQDVDEFRRLVLRPYSSSTWLTGVEDALAQRLAARVRVDHLAGRTVVLYLNGEYWGVYTLQERFDEHYLVSHYHAREDSVDIITPFQDTGIADHGNTDAYRALYAFMQSADLSDPAAYDSATAMIDIKNFIDYHLLQIVLANTDWPATNAKLWRERGSARRWRWVFFDGDACFPPENFDSFANALDTGSGSWPTNAWSTLFLRRFLENERFRRAFLERLEQLLNEEFTYGNNAEDFFAVTNDYAPEIERQMRRFHNLGGYTEWVYALSPLYGFLRYRHCTLAAEVQRHLGATLRVPECPPVGIDHHHIHETSLSLTTAPNPASSTVTLHISAQTRGEAEACIVDMLGRVVRQFYPVIQAGAQAITVDIGGLPSGAYVVRLRQRGNSSCATLLISASR